jgi:hypothetical protein
VDLAQSTGFIQAKYVGKGPYRMKLKVYKMALNSNHTFIF